MNFTLKQANDGELLIRDLSKKAQKYYYETDPCGVFVKNGKIYVNDNGGISIFDTTKELEEHFEAMVDEYPESYSRTFQVRFSVMNKAQIDGEEPYDINFYDEEIIEASNEEEAIEYFKDYYIESAEENGCRAERKDDEILFYSDEELYQSYIILKAVECEL